MIAHSALRKGMPVRKLFPLVLTAGLVVLAAVLLVQLLTPAPAYDPVRAATERQAIAQAEALAPLDLLLAALWRLVPLAAVVGVLIIAARWAWLRLRLVRVDAVPVVLEQLADVSPAVLATYGQARVLAAQHPNVPHSLTYSPHWSNRQDGRVPVLENQEAHTAPPVAAPSFAQLLDTGRIGPGNPLLLGVGADGVPVEGSWLDLFSVGIGGLGGSGKTWTGVFLLSQAVLHGARVAILDPHSGDAEGIAQRLDPLARAGRYLCDPAGDPRTMLATVQLLSDELSRRAKGTSPSRQPWVIVADEFSALMRGELAGPLAALFEAIAQEGRKLGIYGLALGQTWTASRSGGTEVRDALASCYIHRLRPAQARYLSGLSADDLPDDLLELPSGIAYLLSTRGTLQRLTIPQMGAGDVARVADLLDSNGRPVATTAAPTMSGDVPVVKPDGSQFVATSERLLKAAESASTPSADAARAAALFFGGADLARVVFELRGVKSSEGGRYQRALAEVQQLVREGTQPR